MGTGVVAPPASVYIYGVSLALSVYIYVYRVTHPVYGWTTLAVYMI